MNQSVNWQQYDDWLDALRLRRQIPGWPSGSSPKMKCSTSGFGFRNAERGLPVDSDTIFGIASVTKSFTALTVLQAASADSLTSTTRSRAGCRN